MFTKNLFLKGFDINIGSIQIKESRPMKNLNNFDNNDDMCSEISECNSLCQS